MKIARKRKLYLIVSLVALFGIIIGLILYALGQNISLFYSPTQIVKGEAPLQRSIRVGGMVVPGSVVRSLHGVSVRFKLTDYKNVIEVFYNGILPDLFREGQGIVAQGRVLNNNQVKATEVLAKHDENYMPPEVKNALAKTYKKGDAAS